MDVRASYRKNRSHASHIIFLDLQNATNNQNIFGRFYDRYSQQLETSYQASLVPLLNYHLEFKLWTHQATQMEYSLTIEALGYQPSYPHCVDN